MPRAEMIGSALIDWVLGWVFVHLRAVGHDQTGLFQPDEEIPSLLG